MMTVRNMVSPRTGVEVANQFIIEGDGKTTFQSYSSPIVEIDWNAKTIKFGEDWDYSVTTSKYRNAFLYEYFRPLAMATKDIRRFMQEVQEKGSKLISQYGDRESFFTVTMM